MGDLTSVVAISKEIVKIGAIINRPQKAELLTIFIEAAMCAIDNQVRLLTQRLEESHQEIPRVLCLNHYQNFSVPSPSSLTGQLLERIALFDITLPYASQKAPGGNWVVPIGQEQIVNLNPDCILIITENKQAIEEEIFTESSLKDVVAVKNKKIFFLDDAIQMSPSQYVVLAYQDLVEALARLL
jgi:iron complex transport system substrate-binding protein